MQFSVFQQSRIGGRSVNQDRMGYLYTRDALLLVLADGMGGHPRGEVAADLALQTMSALFRARALPRVPDPGRFLTDACLAAHEAIRGHAHAHAWADGPRTTVVACLVQGGSALWAHCGDSRLYWIRGGRVLARTRDHTHIEQLIAKGRADVSERRTHPDRNKLYNCLGADDAPRVALSCQAPLAPGDALLLCSDGVWTVLSDAEIAHQLSTQPVAQAVPGMLAMATAIAGPRADNATALAIGWQGAAAFELNALYQQGCP
jgi:serine/threonine protein phosphatase PrpC